MKTIQIGNEQYTLEFSFEAAENKAVVQRMFNALSMSYIGKRLDLEGKNSKVEIAAAMIDGTADLISDMPHICKDAFYAGLLEHHHVTFDESKKLMKQYMKEKKMSFKGLYEEIKETMEEDGFFDLTGLTEMVAEMNKQDEEEVKKVPKTPQDHKKKIDFHKIIWEEYFKNALRMGISHESFLRLTPKKLEIYAEAYKLMLRDRDYENWLMGQYNMKAFSVVLDQVLAGMNKRKSKAKYFESPILEMAEKNNEPLSEKELQLQRELFVAKLEALKTNFEINHNKQ